ncbi:MAG: hypothetical protein WAL04_02730 [Acidimicrobiales bacterium]
MTWRHSVAVGSINNDGHGNVVATTSATGTTATRSRISKNKGERSCQRDRLCAAG